MSKKILKVISAFNQNYYNLMLKTFPSVQEFCELNGFEYELRLLGDDYYRPASWYKLDFILDEIKNNNHEYVLWIDTDALIHNKNYNIINNIINAHSSDKHIFISKDHNDFNCGIILLKCSQFTENLISKISSMNHYLNHAWWEQAAFVDLYNQNYLNCQDKVQVLDQILFNSYMYQEYNDVSPNNRGGQFDKNKSFIVHFPGMSLAKKEHYAQNYLNQ